MFFTTPNVPVWYQNVVTTFDLSFDYVSGCRLAATLHFVERSCLICVCCCWFVNFFFSSQISLNMSQHSLLSLGDKAFISVRIVTMDYTLEKPIENLDPLYSATRGHVVKRVPIIRIFGITPAGQKIWWENEFSIIKHFSMTPKLSSVSMCMASFHTSTSPCQGAHQRVSSRNWPRVWTRQSISAWQSQRLTRILKYSKYSQSLECHSMVIIPRSTSNSTNREHKSHTHAMVFQIS